MNVGVNMAMTPGRLIWITGLAGSGKTTIGRRIYADLKRQHSQVVFLDGDDLRQALGSHIGYSQADRLALGMTYCRLCNLLCKQGIEVVCATISLFRECHDWNRQHTPDYVEIYVQTSLEVLIARDHNRLYSRALRGELANVVGIGLDFMPPARPDIVLRNDGPIHDIDALVNTACAFLNCHKMDMR